ncbi:hypothetical protein GGX14DRAFT_631691 [Mycena pura]|uniref:Protein prenyltransferase n=1 Tax=Mycena pura TaxID=153505 RepID=A0AAD6YA72_9AGAR|nr:hypothetical protein GGX14DRAFT_631691 [Mycena pura]
MALVHTLGNLLMQSSVLSVEIVPGGMEQWAIGAEDFPFLYTDGHLGVPQRVLYQLYLLAIPLLNTNRDIPSQADASCVVLLANPAHQTALNTRKRLIQSASLSASAELAFSARVIASSRPCAKESIQWAHRRWLLAFIYPRAHSGGVSPAHDGDPVPDIPPETIENEFGLISRCCELYPRNYHAWSHHHFIVECILASLGDSHPSDSPHLPQFVRQIQNLRHWIECHVSDYSAMHQTCNVVSRLQSLHQYHTVLGELADPSYHFEHAMSLVTSFPGHESLWMYLRAIIGASPTNASTFIALAMSSAAELSGPFRDQFILWVKRGEIVDQLAIRS